MAQTGYTPISIFYSTTASTAPTAGSLVNGELAINTNDGVLYYKDSSGVVQKIGTKGGVGTSTTTQVLYNSSGSLAGSANMTFNGTTLTLANDASISGLTVGKGGGAVGTNTALGGAALANNTTGSLNTAIGYSALNANTDNSANTAVGYAALTGQGAGVFQNTAVGANAMGGATVTGSNNTAIGRSAMYSNTSGASNASLGFQALYSNTTASNNTAVGYQAGYSTTGAGAEETFIGTQAGYSVTTGVSNTFVGRQAGYSVTTGAANTFIGGGWSGNNVASGYYVTTGSRNTILGNYSGNQGGLDIRTASNYIVLSDGDGNPRQVIDSSGNVGIGASSSGSYRLYLSGSNATTAVGVVYNDTGTSGRTYAMRSDAGSFITTDVTAGTERMRIDSSGNLLVGTTSTGVTNTKSIIADLSTEGYLIVNHTGTASGTVFEYFGYNGNVIGSITQNGTTGVLYNLTSDYRLKNNPVSLTGASEFIMALQPKSWDWYDGSGKGVGFIAHEFMEVAKYSGNGKKDEVDAEGKPIYQSIQPSSSEVMANLVALVQELKAEVDSLKQQLGK